MELRAHSLDEDILIAEHAAEWLIRAHAADAREKERLLAWLSRSPLHSGELLAATSLDLAMREVFRHKHIDVDQFISASVNILAMSDRVQVESPQPVRGKRTRLFAAAGLGVAAATVALVVTPTPLRSWLYPCEYVAPVGQQRVLDLPEGSAIAINAGSGMLVIFAANARDVYVEGGQVTLAPTKGPVQPFRVHVVASSNENPTEGKAAIIQALGNDVELLRRLDRVIGNAGPIAPPMKMNLSAVNPWENTIVVERRGSDVLIR